MGRATQGKLLNSQSYRNTSKPKSRTTYRMDFQFQVVRQTYSGSCSVSSQAYGTYQSGDTIPVTYLPSDPSINTFGGTGEIMKDLWLNLLGALLSGAVGCLGVWALRNRKYV